jgi:hypothetical protein
MDVILAVSTSAGWDCSQPEYGMAAGGDDTPTVQGDPRTVPLVRDAAGMSDHQNEEGSTGEHASAVAIVATDGAKLRSGGASGALPGL